MPLNTKITIIYSSTIVFLYTSCSIPVKGSESSERHIANKKCLEGGGKSGQESQRTNRDDRDVISGTVSSERERKTTWHCWKAVLILSLSWALNITSFKLSQPHDCFLRWDPPLRNTNMLKAQCRDIIET